MRNVGSPAVRRLNAVVVHARQCVRNKDLQLRLAWATPSWTRGNYEAALNAAREADDVVFFACDAVVNMERAMGRYTAESRITLGEEQSRLLADVIRAKPDCVLGLATGSSPIGTYDELVRMHREEGLSFARCTTVNLDE